MSSASNLRRANSASASSGGNSNSRSSKEKAAKPSTSSSFSVSYGDTVGGDSTKRIKSAVAAHVRQLLRPAYDARLIDKEAFKQVARGTTNTYAAAANSSGPWSLGFVEKAQVRKMLIEHAMRIGVKKEAIAKLQGGQWEDD